MSALSQKIPALRAAGVALAVSGILTSTTIFAQNTYTGAPVLSAGSIGSHPLDSVFAQLREAARANNPTRAAQLADQLSDYPIQSYVNYYRLKPQLYNTDGTPNVNAPDDEIKQFINTYATDAIGDRMRNDYALVLAARQDWSAFRTQYAQFVLKDDMQLKCYEQMAEAAEGKNVIESTRLLLTESKFANTKACQQLLNNLARTGGMSEEDINYFAALSAYGSGTQGQALASKSRNSSGASRMASLITQANNDSTGSLASTVSATASGLTPQQGALANAYYGYSAARRADSSASSFYNNAYQQYSNLKLPDDVLGWQARAGMRVNDWNLVASAIDKMSDAEKNTAIWQYWRGRAYAAQGKKAQASEAYANAAKSFDFYGILATEALGKRVALPPMAAAPTSDEMREISKIKSFERARKFQSMNMTLEYNREWNFPLRAMNDRQLLASAEHAHKLGMLDRMINTSERSKTEFNFKQRYPTPFLSIMQNRAAEAGITPAWAYGITRQESRFVVSARSGANANGLMQIIPETARAVARRIGLTGFTLDQLYNTDTNIQLGTAYLGQIRDQFNGSLPMASAGYNAGPGRPAQWRRSLTGSVDGAVFAETIPFSETRNYVKNVMANTIYYHLLIDGSAPSLTNLMGTVYP
ncbi:lytic transglycosylase domain-containing protein [Hydromonas duriensis]|uniref:Soluble lytic murein transglycosylase n=1 Tax=Hydromonas duriensis TaxID=1527608 RepID=A0A4V6PY49_9BURK|nr:lytic transglycosylase domain-containing protein [Hydromonas duriensis]TDR32777.1 soluble lytic murein transglycosylase [Hydromonas duriensis]